MLGTSLQARAVPLLELDRPVGAAEGSDGWYPPGRNLRVVFSALSGWTHEDAIVVSRSAAEKLTSEFVVAKRLLIPAVAYYKLEVQTRGDKVQRGQPMVRVYIDLYALGWRKHEAEALNASDGCLEITVPDAQSPMDGELTEDVEIRTLRTPKWRASLVFKIRGIVPLGVGDNSPPGMASKEWCPRSERTRRCRSTRMERLRSCCRAWVLSAEVQWGSSGSC